MTGKCMKLIYYSILFLILVVADQVFLKEVLDEKKPKCNGTATIPIGKVEFNQNNASITCNFTIKPPEEKSVGIFIMFEKMIIDENDNVTIKTVPVNDSSEVVFGPLHAQPNSFVLITGLKELVIELKTSNRVVQREFATSYHSQDCSFTVHDDIATITQPVYASGIKSPTTCDYLYDVKVDSNTTFSFSFDSFNMSKSSIILKGAAELPDTTLGGDEIPGDFLSGSGQVSLEVLVAPNSSDHFALSRHKAYSVCSVYKDGIDGRDTFTSPHLPALIDQDVPTECHWHMKSRNPGEALGLKFNDINLRSIFDVFTVTDGSHTSTMPLLQVTKSTQNSSLVQEIRTTSSEMILTFSPETFLSNVTFDVFSAGAGSYMRGNGTFKATSIPNRPNDTLFLLEVPSDKNVVLNFKSFSLSPPAALEIYEDFTFKSRKIATLKSDVWYPIISSTSKIMIAAINYNNGQFEAEFAPATEGCMHMSPGSSDHYILSGNCKSTCSWIIPPVDDKNGLLLLSLQYLALEVDDEITILHLDKNKTLVGKITSKTDHVPQFSLNTAVGAFVNVTRGSCKKEEDIILVAHAEYLPDCSLSYILSPDELLQITSPSYPDTYPLFSHCNSSIKQASKNQMLHLAFSKLELASDHCIQISSVSENGSSSFQVSGIQMPDDVILNGDVSVLFNSGSCNTTKEASSFVSKQGFVLNLTAISCGRVATDKVGSLKINSNTSLCIFKVTVPASETDGSVNTIIYSMEEEKSGNYKLDVHNGGSVRNDVISNSTGTDIWSRTNSLVFVYRRLNDSEPSAKVTIKYQTKSCSKSMQCENGICMHPDWKCDGKNDCGDYSDEKNCQSSPQPPEPSGANGVSHAVFGVCIILFFALGVCVTLCTPWILQKYRNRYHHFQDLSVIE